MADDASQAASTPPEGAPPEAATPPEAQGGGDNPFGFPKVEQQASAAPPEVPKDINSRSLRG